MPIFEHASQRERDALDESVARVLSALGCEDALVSDESKVSDFLEFGGRPHRIRRGPNGTWEERPGDPAVLERNEQRLTSASAKLGVPVDEQDLIVDIARRVRTLGLA